MWNLFALRLIWDPRVTAQNLICILVKTSTTTLELVFTSHIGNLPSGWQVVVLLRPPSTVISRRVQ